MYLKFSLCGSYCSDLRLEFELEAFDLCLIDSVPFYIGYNRFVN